MQQGPNIVVVGGGTGLSVLLRGLKEYSSNITAIVSVGDDGGSSGRIREEFGMVPVGDVRNCIVALSDREELMEQIFDYRFKQGEGLDGHSLGNLLLVAMTHLTGSFHDAVSDINEVLQIRGKVLPVTDVPITLKAILDDDSEIVGESCVSQADRPIMRLTIEPENVQPLSEALDAIREADAIILGPGSLFTSIIPNLLVDGIVEAILQSRAMKFYVCNVMTQAGETDNYSAEDHLRVLLEHGRKGIADYIVVNSRSTISEDVLARYADEGAAPVYYNKAELEALKVKVIEANLLNEQQVLRHDSARLAACIMDVIYTRCGLKFPLGWRKIYKIARKKAK
ncbi:MAG: YvcK family protein [Peptococcaceae bacterium]|nr:YvcK family protein [Peptococcaceae bacterium]MBO5300812.1 YvcK family protein [Peptococcaceae bacterium]MBO5429256.1 YvcK family protein [Peptococcaceae bacterium]MBP3340952.1 YvcK family protein [Peptococcaceae bacterium]MBP3584103.1 YvcK family protein [Peptococcaceae bacterium]